MILFPTKQHLQQDYLSLHPFLQENQEKRKGWGDVISRNFKNDGILT